MAKPTPDQIEQIATWFREGRSVEWIAVTMDIHRATLSRWISRGRKEEPGSVYRALADAVADARKEARNGGRPSKAELADDAAKIPLYAGKINEQTCKRICSLLRQGRSLDDAATLSGVSGSTARGWIKRGYRDGVGLCHDFAIEAKLAEAQSKHLYESRMEQLALQSNNLPTAERACSKILERRWIDWAPPMQREPREAMATLAKAVEDEAYEPRWQREFVPSEFIECVSRRIKRYSGRAPAERDEANARPALPMAE
jgi:transposase